jgi:hypothetical protein
MLSEYTQTYPIPEVDLSPGTSVFIMDCYVKKVAEFMQRNIPEDALRGTARALAEVAPALWSIHKDSHIRSVGLYEVSIGPAKRKAPRKKRR